ncbi:MAG: hypothetical protein QF578_12690 [Alphaproteobacteria bacterium]|jgi:hypothetical protein|nr:hypothetical protein [Alphaproteobacteria bacterium]MDP6816368.1 hypothetical protein [Alphaproteobacteria bacterium]
MLLASAAATALLLAACNPQTTAMQKEGIGFRQARFAEISAMRDYRQCRDDAVQLDRQARAAASPARYLAAARALEKCEAGVGPEGAQVGQDERMRAYALSVQDHFKGGDVAKARANLATFKESYPGADLYYADGASFVETMEILLGLRDRTAVGEFSTANVGGELKGELRRVRYWTRN